MPAGRRVVVRCVVVLSIISHSPAVLADLWAYVDERGRSHVANHQVDSRYKLFFKGETTLDAPSRPADARKVPVEALATARPDKRTNPARVKRFGPLIETQARANGLDPALVMAVVAVESAFDPRAISDRGAIGLMQLLPETGKRYGVTADARRSIAQKLLDPTTNLRIGTRYLSDLLARFANDVPLALAAYNAGEAAVAIHHNSVPPFAATRDFVKLVQQLYALYRPEPPTPATPVRFLEPQPRTIAESAAPGD